MDSAVSIQYVQFRSLIRTQRSLALIPPPLLPTLGEGESDRVKAPLPS